ncbi:NAD-dependent epimerase/dehydratase family protein [Curtobacterium sp. 24E2]
MADTAAEPLSILIAGASGFIGTPLVRALREAGHHVTTLVRREPHTATEFRWAPGRRPLDPAIVDGADVVINLAGANIGKLPWTAKYREEIRRSRVDATDTLVEAMRHASTPRRCSCPDRLPACTAIARRTSCRTTRRPAPGSSPRSAPRGNPRRTLPRTASVW